MLVAANENAAFCILEEHRFDVDLVLVGVTRHNEGLLDRLKSHLPDSTFLLLASEPESSSERVSATISRDVFYPESLVPKVKRLLEASTEPRQWQGV